MRPLEVRQRISQTMKGRVPKNIAMIVKLGPKNINWRGDDISYRGIHKWVERQLGKAIKCVKNPSHKSTRYHWANVSGKYKRDLNDFRQLCPSCNMKERVFQ